jgi:hypothetical protein
VQPSSALPRRARIVALAAVVLGAFLAGASPAMAGPGSLETVAGGLSNPRGMTFGPDGGLYVAEAGRGGPGPCVPGPEGDSICYGTTGAITSIDVRSGAEDTVLEGLPSLAEPSGADATGPQDVSFGRRGGAYYTVGLGADPRQREELLGDAGADFAALYRIGRHGNVRKVADLGAYEAENNPDEGQPSAEVDSNPYSVDASGRPILVTDAGGNDLLGVTRRGNVSTLAVFPFFESPVPDVPIPGLPPVGTPIPTQPVPTGVVRGPDGSAYVGQLTGFPFPAGAASVFRVGDDGEPEAILTGFTNIVDIAFGNNALYVLQISAAGLLAGPPDAPPVGALIKVSRDGTRTELVPGQLTQPTGLAISPKGGVYVANKGGSPDEAEIVRVKEDDGKGHGKGKHKKQRKHR